MNETANENIFSDSQSRLRWVKYLIAKIEPIVRAIDQQSRDSSIVYETKVYDGFEHARFFKAVTTEIPEGLGFTIADIAVNARSCLDMAIQSVVDNYGLEIPRPQFPIENDIGKKKRDSTEKLLNQLPPSFKRVVLSLQPRYETPFGHFDSPLNEEVLMIREISNTNKHRNITPVMQTLRMVGHMDVEGFTYATVGEAESAWSDGKDNLLEIRYPVGTGSDERLAGVQPFGTMQLMIHHSGMKYGRLDFALPIDASEFLALAPKYVEHALAALQRAHEETQAAS